MFDNNEDFRTNHPSNNHEKKSSDDWQEINDLLGYAEKLKSRCDELADRIFLLNTVQLFLVFSTIAFSVAIFGLVPGLYLNANLSGIAILLIYFGATLSFLFIEALSRILKTRISTDKRGLDSTVDFLRDNSYSISKDWSPLEKIQLKIKLSLFDINTSTSPWSKLKKSFSGDFLLWLAGVDAGTLALIDLKSETARYRTIGFTLLLQLFLFFMSGYIIFSSTLIINQVISIFLSLIWAIVIFSIYRFVMISTLIVSPKTSKVNSLITNAARVVLALLIALTISVPVELMIFKPEIELQMTEHNRSVLSHAIIADYDIQKIDNQKKFIEREIFAINSNVIRLKENLVSEINGGSSKSSKDAGSIAQRNVKDIEEQLKKQSDLISKSEISKNILEKERQERVFLLERKYYSTIENSSLVVRIDALRQLTRGNSTAGFVSILINIVIVAMEIMPIASGLSMKDTLYEKVLRRREAEILVNKQEELQKDVIRKELTDEDKSFMEISQATIDAVKRI